ncbi:holin [Streptomyces sp. 3MP-14]|uniref:Holin n=1 Tax=Streptomyces mimosae TaxID=2586635 RepID=A0A5N6A2B8_9ACTN|nr:MULTISPECIES: holin [Streptomyces]KAB8162914.1 holin [Streptomyces mimosae]KAB8179127.1 holin [Streptomyces sp. 3MP-14]
MTTWTFWRATLERAVRTAAQTLVAVLGAGAVDLLSVDWPAALATAGGAALLAVLTAVATPGGPGATETPTPAPARAGLPRS